MRARHIENAGAIGAGMTLMTANGTRSLARIVPGTLVAAMPRMAKHIVNSQYGHAAIISDAAT